MRKQFWIALSVASLSLWASPKDAFALKKALCSNVTCTGGTPRLTSGSAPGLSHIFMSNNTATNNPPWTAVGGTSGRLIARGDSGGNLLATGVVVY